MVLSVSIFRLLGAAAALLLGSRPLPAQKMPATPGTGLRGEYYAGQNFDKLVLTRLDPTIDFDWTTGPPNRFGSTPRFVEPGPGVPAQFFSVRWTGRLYVPRTGRYTFRSLSDDGMRVWVGGKKILDEWRDQRATEATAEIELTGGRYYPLRVEYYQVEWDTRALLTWQLPGSAEPPQPIPAANLYVALPTSARPLPPAGLPEPAVAPAVLPVAAPRRRVAPSAPRPVAAVPRRPTLPVVPVAPPAAVLPARPDSTPAARPDLGVLSRGATVPLPSLYFTQSTAVLLPASRPLLNELARRLRAQPALRLEIAGHTDNVGEPALNLRLSEQRARTVRRYLVQQGIDSVRLTARGYGGTRPVADNQDPQQRPRNRRVEAVVR